MHRAILAPNKIVERKSQERSRDRHQKKLQELKPPSLDDHKNAFKHSQRNLKKPMTDEEQKQIIEQDNKLLLHRLENIMKKKISKEYINENYNHHTARVRSLNRDSRKRALVKITEENQLLFKRIQNQKSDYSVKRWLESHRQEQKYLQNISEYPIQLYSNLTPRVGGVTEIDTEPQIMTVRILYIFFR